MEGILEATVFSVIEPPNVRIKKPDWMELPSAMSVFAFVLTTYFIVTGGVIYDIINEPPSVGSTVDERGFQRPQAILPGRINGQYIMEGLAASFMFTLGGVGLIFLTKANEPSLTRKSRIILLAVGLSSVVLAFLATRTFMRVKMPSYGY